MADAFGIPRRGEEGSVCAHRLPDEHDRLLDPSSINDGYDVVDQGRAQQLPGPPRAPAMPALLHRRETPSRGEVTDGGAPSAGVARQSMHEHHRLPGST